MTYEQPPGAAALCARCGLRLIAVYPNQQHHPNCDPNAPGLTEDQIDHWAARYHANNRQDQP